MDRARYDRPARQSTRPIVYRIRGQEWEMPPFDDAGDLTLATKDILRFGDSQSGLAEELNKTSRRNPHMLAALDLKGTDTYTPGANDCAHVIELTTAREAAENTKADMNRAVLHPTIRQLLEDTAGANETIGLNEIAELYRLPEAKDPNFQNELNAAYEQALRARRQEIKKGLGKRAAGLLSSHHADPYTLSVQEVVDQSHAIESQLRISANQKADKIFDRRIKEENQARKKARSFT